MLSYNTINTLLVDIACHLFTVLMKLKTPTHTHYAPFCRDTLILLSLFGRIDPTHCKAVLYSAPASSMTSCLPPSLWSHMTGSEEGKEWNARLNANHFLYGLRIQECFWRQEAGSDMFLAVQIAVM